MQSNKTNNNGKMHGHKEDDQQMAGNNLEVCLLIKKNKK
jgi:hypothetical protein